MSKLLIPRRALITGAAVLAAYGSLARAWPVHGVASGATFATFDLANKGTSQTLSNGNLTDTGNAATSGLARSTRSTMGKVHFEIHLDSFVDGNGPEIGFCTASAGLNTFIGADTQSWAITLVGTKVYGGSSGANIGVSFAVGDTVAVELDAASGTIQFQKAGSGTWFPDNSLPSFGGAALYGCVNVPENGSAMTANFGATAFAVTPTAGYGTF